MFEQILCYLMFVLGVCARAYFIGRIEIERLRRIETRKLNDQHRLTTVG